MYFTVGSPKKKKKNVFCKVARQRLETGVGRKSAVR